MYPSGMSETTVVVTLRCKDMGQKLKKMAQNRQKVVFPPFLQLSDTYTDSSAQGP